MMVALGFGKIRYYSCEINKDGEPNKRSSVAEEKEIYGLLEYVNKNCLKMGNVLKDTAKSLSFEE